MAKGHELLQQLLHRGIGSRTLSLPLYYNTLAVIHKICEMIKIANL